MESHSQHPNFSRMHEVLSEISAGLDEYYQDRSKVDVWKKIFRIIGVYVSKEGALSSEAQKIINFYLQNKVQSSPIYPTINDNKQIICKVFDFATSNTQSIDDSLSTGMLRQIVNKKLSKQLQGENPYSPTIKVLHYCIEAVTIHFCDFLQKYKKANGVSLIYTTRQIPMIIDRKSDVSSSNQQLMAQIQSHPVSLLEGMLENVKPILTNYFNMESLFQVTSINFKNKKGLLIGFQNSDTNKLEMACRTTNLNTIFDSTYAGRQTIENKLSTLSLFSQKQSQSNFKWSLLTIIQQLQPILHHILGKLPLFLRPKANGDILSFLRKEFTPTFKYQVMNSGYVEGPFLSQFMQVFINVGRGPVQILSFPYSKQTAQQLKKHEGQKIWENIEKLSINYSKIKLGIKSIAVIPPHNYYMIGSDVEQKNKQRITELVYWSILPKTELSIKRTTQATHIKKKLYPSYFIPPLELAFLDYLSHQYTKIANIQILKHLILSIQKKLEGQENSVYQLLQKDSSISLQMSEISYTLRFCFNCKNTFLNYCWKSKRQQYFCMACSSTIGQSTKIDSILIIYHQNKLRYPLTLCKVFLKKGKVPAQKIQNIYQTSICNEDFIGAFQNQKCKGKPNSSSVDISNSPMKNQKGFELIFTNKIKQMKITTPEQMLVELALKTPQNEGQRKQLVKKIETFAKSIKDVQGLLKQICPRYDVKNLVEQIMWIFKRKNKVFD